MEAQPGGTVLKALENAEWPPKGPMGHNTNIRNSLHCQARNLVFESDDPDRHVERWGVAASQQSFTGVAQPPQLTHSVVGNSGNMQAGPTSMWMPLNGGYIQGTEYGNNTFCNQRPSEGYGSAEQGLPPVNAFLGDLSVSQGVTHMGATFLLHHCLRCPW